MNNRFSDAFSITPKPLKSWQDKSNESRLDLVREVLTQYPLAATKEMIEIVEAKIDGQVIVRLGEPLGPDKRGTVLLDLEEYLKNVVDKGLTIWLEPLGDRNSLRNLRGIEVKA